VEIERTLPNGLVVGHAYSVTDAKTVCIGFCKIRRNFKRVVKMCELRKHHCTNVMLHKVLNVLTYCTNSFSLYVCVCVLLGEHYCVYVRLMTWAVSPSVCLSSVSLRRSCSLLKWLNVSTMFCTKGLALGQFVLKFWKKTPRSSRWSCKLNGRGY